MPTPAPRQRSTEARPPPDPPPRPPQETSPGPTPAPTVGPTPGPTQGQLRARRRSSPCPGTRAGVTPITGPTPARAYTRPDAKTDTDQDTSPEPPSFRSCHSCSRAQPSSANFSLLQQLTPVVGDRRLWLPTDCPLAQRINRHPPGLQKSPARKRFVRALMSTVSGIGRSPSFSQNGYGHTCVYWPSMRCLTAIAAGSLSVSSTLNSFGIRFRCAPLPAQAEALHV